MKHKFPRMNQHQKDVCPSGYVWITNINVEDKHSFMDAMLNTMFDTDGHRNFFQRTKDTYRKLYGDVQVVTPAYTNAGIELKDDSVALYVPNQGLRRIQRWLRNHNKMKGGNLPY